MESPVNSELDMELQLEKLLKNSNYNNMPNIYVLSVERYIILYFRTLLKDNVLESGDAMDVKRVLQEELGNFSNL